MFVEIETTCLCCTVFTCILNSFFFLLIRPWLLEALPFVYKQEVFKLIKEKILSKDLKVNEAVPVLRGLALTTNPTEPMCRDISVSDVVPYGSDITLMHCYTISFDI